jgi:hypothetical protein
VVKSRAELSTNKLNYVRFKVVTATSKKMTDFWEIADISEVCTASIISPVEAVQTSGTSVYFYDITRLLSQKPVIFKLNYGFIPVEILMKSRVTESVWLSLLLDSK